jgi:hypothetical protein
MYAIVKKVVSPPRTSRLRVDPRADISKKRSRAPRLSVDDGAAPRSSVEEGMVLMVASQKESFTDARRAAVIDER